MNQLDLFSPWPHDRSRQPALPFRSGFEFETDRPCREPGCLANLVVTETGYLCCPRGHGKLIPNTERTR